MGWIVGFEPTTFSATNWRSNQLNYIHHKEMARLKRFELLAHCLEGSCSIQLSYRRISGAGDGNRTHTTSLEGWDSTIELHPQFNNASYFNINHIFCQHIFMVYFYFLANRVIRYFSYYPSVNFCEIASSPDKGSPIAYRIFIQMLHWYCYYQL